MLGHARDRHAAKSALPLALTRFPRFPRFPLFVREFQRGYLSFWLACSHASSTLPLHPFSPISPFTPICPGALARVRIYLARLFLRLLHTTSSPVFPVFPVFTVFPVYPDLSGSSSDGTYLLGSFAFTPPPVHTTPVSIPVCTWRGLRLTESSQDSLRDLGNTAKPERFPRSQDCYHTYVCLGRKIEIL